MNGGINGFEGKLIGGKSGFGGGGVKAPPVLGDVGGITDGIIGGKLNGGNSELGGV